MSQDDQEANKRKIISQMSPSGKDEYDKYDNKISWYPLCYPWSGVY